MDDLKNNSDMIILHPKSVEVWSDHLEFVLKVHPHSSPGTGLRLHYGNYGPAFIRMTPAQDSPVCAHALNAF